MRHRKSSQYLFSAVILLGLLLISCGCQTPKRSIPFIAMREANFRLGPIDLPLDKQERDNVLLFLQRGGNWENQDLTDLEAPAHYSGLLDRLSDPDFLYSHNFRDNTQIDRVAPAMRKWFHDPIIYQIVDASLDRPPVHNPMSISDGKYWWVFYTQRESLDSRDSKLVQLTITASLSKSMRHYEHIQEQSIQSPSRNLDKSTPPEIYAADVETPSQYHDMHSAFLKQLLQIAHVQLVSRLKDDRLGFAFSHDVRIFIPDIHLLSLDRKNAFKYGTNHISLLAPLALKLHEFKKSAVEKNVRVTVYQLGDFFDLWREIPIYLSKDKFAEGTAAMVQKIAEDHQILYETLFGPDLDIHFVLGNHDFDVHFLEDFISAELRYYFPFSPETNPIAVALHGAVFDKRERVLSDAVKHAAVYYLGPSVKERTLDLTPVREFIVQDHGDDQYWDYIQHPIPPKLGQSLLLRDENLLGQQLGDSNFNVLSPEHPDLPKQDLVFFPQARDFVDAINTETGWKVRIVVCGHTHHARIVIDDRKPEQGGAQAGFFVLVDCGAWIEAGNLNGEIVPNAQIAIMYNNDIRVYQLSPRD